VSHLTHHLSPLLDLQALAHVLGRSPSTIRRDMRRNPDAVPPRMQLPGTRLLRWREADVVAWLDLHVGCSSAARNGGAQ
jgi:predicted DNA-binding transcriptional regulator AlpA